VNPALASFRRLTMHCKAFAFFTLVSGAFVAGLDAGRQADPPFPAFGYCYVKNPLPDTLRIPESFNELEIILNPSNQPY
jgi:hypothetical protein